MLPTDTLEGFGDASMEVPTLRRSMLVIVNPYATTVSDRMRYLVVHALQSAYDVRAVDTTGKGHATELAREAAVDGVDVVVAFGGDGTVNETANGLAGTATPMTTLPGGSANVFCKMLGIPGDIVDATGHLLRVADRFAPRSVDLARVNDRFFTFASGMGWDAAVVARVDAHPRLKRRWGPRYFTAAAISEFTRRYVVRPPRLAIEVDGVAMPQGLSVFVQNGDPYTYFGERPIHVADDSRLDSGHLAGAVLRRARITDMPALAYRTFVPTAPLTRSRAIAGFEDADEVVVRPVDGVLIPLHVDGDHIGDATEARFSVVPGGLAVVS